MTKVKFCYHCCIRYVSGDHTNCDKPLTETAKTRMSRYITTSVENAVRTDSMLVTVCTSMFDVMSKNTQPIRMCEDYRNVAIAKISESLEKTDYSENKEYIKICNHILMNTIKSPLK